MGLAAGWDERQVERQTIGGERRASRRYSICLDVQWRIVHRRRVVESGSGRTRDLSSDGILFEAGRQLASRRHLELSISWPVLLYDKAPLKLVVSGRVVRSDETCAAIRMTRHDSTPRASCRSSAKRRRGGQAPAGLECRLLGRLAQKLSGVLSSSGGLLAGESACQRLFAAASPERLRARSRGPAEGVYGTLSLRSEGAVFAGAVTQRSA